MKLGFAIAPALIAAVATMFAAAGAIAQQSVYTVRHTVSATAADAVKAKAAAMARGREEAARIVFKRVVPLGSYRRIPELDSAQIEDMIEGVTVRAEQNSTTTYIATLSFGFDPSAVREALAANGLSVVDAQAPIVRLMPIIVADGAVKFESREGWGSAWGLQDLTGSLAPLAVVKPDASLTPDKLKAILSGDRAAFEALKQQAGTDKIILAVASEIEDGKRFGTRLYGADAVGPIDLSRTDRVFGGDAREAAQRAALIAQRVIETRWKIQQGGDSPAAMPWAENGAGAGGYGGQPDTADPAQGYANAQPEAGAYPAQPAAPPPAEEKTPRDGGSFFGNLFGFGKDAEEKRSAPVNAARRVSMTVEFAGLQQWQAIRSELVVVPGLEALEIGTLTARNARVAFNYAGDVERLRSDLAARGLSLRDSGGSLVLVQN